MYYSYIDKNMFSLNRNISILGAELDISEETPTTQEIRASLSTLRNGKAPGADQITAEMLKADLDQNSKDGVQGMDKGFI